MRTLSLAHAGRPQCQGEGPLAWARRLGLLGGAELPRHRRCVRHAPLGPHCRCRPRHLSRSCELGDT
eukprot:8141446-Pyramimonas_sp.AAC.1